MELSSRLAVKARGSLYDVRRLLGKLPLIPSPGRFLFDPIELQKDVSGFADSTGAPAISSPRWTTRSGRTARGSVVNVVFMIDEGPAVPLRSLALVGPTGTGDPLIPDSLQASWRELKAELASARGHRFGEADAAVAQSRTAAWLHGRGFPFATVRSTRIVDSVNKAVDVTFRSTRAAQPDRRHRCSRETAR